MAAIAALSAGLVVGLVSLPAAAAPPGTLMTQTFDYTGMEQTFTVPVNIVTVNGTASISVDASGAAGGLNLGGNPGGEGDKVTSDITVKPGEPLYIDVGGEGQPSDSITVSCGTLTCNEAKGGFNGGGWSGTVTVEDAGDSGAGGGGESDVRTIPAGKPGSAGSRLIVAAGGGGAGGAPQLPHTSGNGFVRGDGGNGGAAGQAGGDGLSPAQRDDGAGGGMPATSSAEGQGGAGGAINEPQAPSSPYVAGITGMPGGQLLFFAGSGGLGEGAAEGSPGTSATWTGGAGGGGGGGVNGGGGGGGGGIWGVGQTMAPDDAGGGGGGAGGLSSSPSFGQNNGDGQIVLTWYAQKSYVPQVTSFNIRPDQFRAEGGGAGPGPGLGPPTGGIGTGFIRSAAIAAATGTTISYKDSEAATAGFEVFRPAKGVKRHGKCVAKPKGKHKSKHGKACTRLVPVGGFSHNDSAGANSFHFTGDIGHRKLAPGSYVMKSAPRLSGQTGPVVQLGFRIVK